LDETSEGVGPFEVTDKLAELAEDLHSRIEAELDPSEGALLADYVVMVASDDTGHLVNRGKLERNASRILAGIVIGEWFNTLAWHCEHKVAA